MSVISLGSVSIDLKVKGYIFNISNFSSFASRPCRGQLLKEIVFSLLGREAKLKTAELLLVEVCLFTIQNSHSYIAKQNKYGKNCIDLIALKMV